MDRRPNRWRTGRSSQAPGRRSRRRASGGIHKRDWLKLLLVLGVILWLGLGEPLSQIDRVLGYLGFH